ncbi:glycoside hydrolase family 78 protein [Embleya hyalina]|uniref:Uncharacterized protein n=1 Tax=Embleya hyalina TaxID=516124 RepID=A0A401YF90_9ACTN|nr:hypothetical protein [Embleya hyalina]GCD93263.1 hypothetical protein EHYA_00906 [Embleya hyalina]
MLLTGLVLSTGVVLAGSLLGYAARSGSPASRQAPTVVAQSDEARTGSDGIGWAVRYRDRGHDRAQRTYRLVISADPVSLDTVLAGGVDPDVWDSGVVHSAQHAGVRPSGFRYESGTTYYWSVRIRDDRDRDSGWSTRERWTAPRP